MLLDKVMITYLLAGMFVLATNVAYCELFADKINERTFLSENITIIHECPYTHVLCVQISIQYFSTSTLTYERPVCIDGSKQHKSGESYKSVVPLALKDELTCSPDYWNKDPLTIYAARLHIFITRKEIKKTIHLLSYSEFRQWATKKIVYDLYIPPPYSRRNCLTLRTKSVSFYHNVMHWQNNLGQSPFIQLPIQLAGGVFPSNDKMGMYLIVNNNFKNPYFSRFMKKKSKTFTISFWIYLSSKCPTTFCNILSFFDNTNEDFTSPVLLLMNSGHIHFQTKYKLPIPDTAFRTDFIVPLRSWNHIVFSVHRSKWSLTMFDINGNEIGKSYIQNMQNEPQLDILNDFGIAGGSQVYSGIRGFMSDVYIYPGIFHNHQQIHKSKRFLNSNLLITHHQRFEDCKGFLHEMEIYLILIQKKLFQQLKQLSCEKYLFYNNQNNRNVCSLRIKDLKRPKIYTYIKHLIYQDVHLQKTLKYARHINITKTLLGDSLFLSELFLLLNEHILSKVMLHIQIKGIKLSSVMVKYLQDSTCLGDPDASYILATSYFYGIGAASIDQKKVLELLLINSEKHLHRLSLLALGNIHYLELIPGHSALSAAFYKTVADYTSKDIHNIENKDMFNDNIRLIYESQIKEHTDEDGDLFQWIKHQASSGIPWAKQRLGRMLYWGSQGVRRNLNMATNFFRMAAEAPDAEPGDHFDYGLLLVKKTDKADIEKGKSELKIAGDQDPRALTVLGWLAETEEHNISKAYAYYMQAYKKGNIDAAFNLGVYHHYGKTNVVSKNKFKAFRLFEEAAIGGQLNSGAMYSHYILSGLKGLVPKNINLGISWARHVGEHSPKIGFYLSEGVRAYRKKHLELSMLYYLLAAFSGIEIANFNIALLCDDQETVVKKYVKKECAWYHYNLTLQREEHQIHAYSLIKMGDKNWYGCENEERNISRAIEYYMRAAKKKEPQAFFNLAFILESEQIDIPAHQMKTIIHLPKIKDNKSIEWRHEVIMKLYERCELLSENDSYLPCRLASQRLWIAKIWSEIKLKIQMAMTVFLSLIVLYKFVNLWRSSQIRIENDNNNLSNP